MARSASSASQFALQNGAQNNFNGFEDGVGLGDAYVPMNPDSNIYGSTYDLDARFADRAFQKKDQTDYVMVADVEQDMEVFKTDKDLDESVNIDCQKVLEQLAKATVMSRSADSKGKKEGLTAARICEIETRLRTDKALAPDEDEAGAYAQALCPLLEPAAPVLGASVVPAGMEAFEEFSLEAAADGGWLQPWSDEWTQDFLQHAQAAESFEWIGDQGAYDIVDSSLFQVPEYWMKKERISSSTPSTAASEDSSHGGGQCVFIKLEEEKESAMTAYGVSFPGFSSLS